MTLNGDDLGFRTARLRVAAVRPIHDDDDDDPVAASVARILSPASTLALPADWRGRYDLARASRWLREREREGAFVLVAREIDSGASVGLVIALPQVDADDGLDMRLGYVIAAEAWGQGFGGELVRGFVDRCRQLPEIHVLRSGVSKDNAASRRILRGLGFVEGGDGGDGGGPAQVHLDLHDSR